MEQPIRTDSTSESNHDEDYTNGADSISGTSGAETCNSEADGAVADSVNSDESENQHYEAIEAHHEVESLFSEDTDTTFSAHMDFGELQHRVAEQCQRLIALTHDKERAEQREEELLARIHDLCDDNDKLRKQLDDQRLREAQLMKEKNRIERNYGDLVADTESLDANLKQCKQEKLDALQDVSCRCGFLPLPQTRPECKITFI